MDLQLTGKRALVTGSSSGIGQSIGAVLAKEGATVVLHGRDKQRTEDAAKAIRAEGVRIHIALGDLATDEGAASVA
ncbi:MAG: SDR family NAD(P)-dependent oxidoreductase, partial [Phycisphaerae bacterium]|nr:SDR family NAD(P)-dependent oxidoreductase [Phycisphaerae bacterium]